MGTIKDQLINGWDAEGKTYKCDTGTATLRTTKKLVICDHYGMFVRLRQLHNDNGHKVAECIAGYDTKKIRAFKDTDLISDEIAVFDEKKSITIK